MANAVGLLFNSLTGYFGIKSTIENFALDTSFPVHWNIDPDSAQVYYIHITYFE